MAAFTENEMKDFKITDWYDLSGQVAVVTGGSTGLGLAITRCLVSAGAKVCVVSFESPEHHGYRPCPGTGGPDCARAGACGHPGQQCRKPLQEIHLGHDGGGL